MSTLSDLRADLATRLAGLSVQVHGTIPPQLAPPCAFVGPGDPYVESNFAGKNFGESLVNLTVTLVTEAGVNDEQADALDDLIIETLALVDPQADLIPQSVERPGRIPLNGQDYLGARINISRITRL